MISKIIDIADYHPDLGIFRPDFNLRDLPSLETEDQKKSYEYIAEQLRNDKVVDIGNNAYLDVFLHELIKELKLSFFRNDVKMLRGVLKRFEFIIDSYRHTQPGSVGLYYPWCAFVQLYLRLSPVSTVNSWIESLSKHGWYSNSNDEIIALFVTLNKISASDYVDVNYFSFFATINLNRFLTTYGQAHIEDILPIVHDLLQRDYQLSGQNYVYKMYTFAEDNISFVEDYYGTLMLNSGYAVDVYEGFDRKFQVDAKVPRYTADVRDAYVGSILKEAETILRNETGVERRWVSERLLYRQIDSAFTDITVLQHARPSFLKPQHYDVYLPDLKIALEYQGEQHFRAIPYFGGEEGLLRTQERDRRKREISVANGVYQIDVLPGYKIASIVEEIASKKPGGWYNLSELVEKAKTLNKNEDIEVEARGQVVSRINTKHNAKIDDDNRLINVIESLIKKARKTKIGQRKLTTDMVLRYQGLCGKYRKNEEYQKELETRIMMYARGIDDHSLDKYWREKQLIKLIGIENFIFDD